jgi:hypothetical protein
MDIPQQTPQWRIVAASACGTSHLKNNQLCQDAHHWQILPDNVLVAAVADGAGSASQGKIGAMIAVETAVENISLQGPTPRKIQDDTQLYQLLQEAVVAAKKAVENEASACNHQPYDLATTLIVMVATPEVVAVAQIGDGVAVAKDLNDNLRALTMPENGEYINETTFLTSPNALDIVQFNLWREEIANVAVLTDGLQMLALNLVLGEPHKPFFSPLFNFAMKAENPTVAKEQLSKFLGSERITQRTDDDLTLIIGVFGTMGIGNNLLQT